MHKRINWALALIITVSALTSLASVETDKSIKIDPSFYNITPYDLVYGNDDAPIKVLEYYSLTCPHCAYFYINVFPPLKKKYIDTGKVKWIKRLYVRDRAALEGTLLLNCVDKSKRENYLRILLAKQSNWAFQKNPGEVLENIANLGGISKQNFQKCMDNKKAAHEMHALTTKAVEVAGVTGTPSFYVNLEKLEAFSDQAFKDRFNEILAIKK